MKETIINETMDNSNETTCPLYMYNKELAHKPILLHNRVLEWYKGDGINCHAIENQHYLEPNSIRNDTLEAVMRRDRLSQIEAIEQIIFQHKLPLALVKTVLTYGTILTEEDDSITIEAPVQVYTKQGSSHYFLAEITGKICDDHIKIWHTFLRDVIMRNYMLDLFKNRLSCSHIPTNSVQSSCSLEVESLMKRLTLEERMAHKTEDNLKGFSSALESETCEVINTAACVTIKQGNTSFTLFKQ